MPDPISGKTQIVIIGLWNTSILVPKWFQKNIPDFYPSEAPQLQIAMNQPFSLKYNLKKIELQASTNKLALTTLEESKSSYVDLTKLATDILDRLPHTPIIAIGHNICFALKEKEKFKFKEANDKEHAAEFYLKAGLVGGVDMQNISHTIPQENYLINLTYSINNKQKTLLFNYHYEVTNEIKTKSFIEQFTINIDNSIKITESLIQ